MRQTFTNFKEPKLYLSHDELIGALVRMFPNAVHGKDFIVGHPVDMTTGKQAGAAQIMAWNLPDLVPDIDQHVTPHWELHGDTIRQELAARNARFERMALLAEADVLVNKAHDSMNHNALVNAMRYRQALRDISTQEGFPHEIDWPKKPV